MSVDHEEEVTRVVATFRKRRTRQRVAVVPALLAVGALVFAGGDGSSKELSPQQAVLVGSAFAAIIGVLIFSFFNWRCPSCKSYLGKGLSPRFCAKCGAQLQL